jgi:hypothetical protein
MSVKKVCLATLITALLGLGTVRGQSTNPSPSATPTPGGLVGSMPGASGAPETAPGYFSTRPADTMGATGDPMQPGQPVNLCLSDWIVGPHGPGCCGPVGGCGPIQEELYLQSGIDFPFSGGVFGHTLKEGGWVIQGGGRTLFFNTEQDAAWVVDLSVSNVKDEGKNPAFEVPLQHIFVPTATTSSFTTTPNFAIVDFVPRAELARIAKAKGIKNFHGQPVLLNKGANKNGPNTIAAEGVSIEDLNRTFANIGFGRDWYLFGQAPTYLNRSCEGGCGDGACGCGGCGSPVWRIGLDGGGRYGSGKLELHQLRHRTHTIDGAFIGAHTDVEIPCGCCIFQAGFRVEWDYTATNLLQGNPADLYDVNLLFTVGTRF